MNYARLLLSPFVLSVAWFFVVIAITKLFARGPTLLSGVIALIFGAPILLSYLYFLTIRKIEKSLIFKKEGFIRRIITGRTVRTIFGIFTSIIFSWVALMSFSLYTPLEWITLFLSIPTYFAVYYFLLPRFRSEVIRPLASAKAIYWSAVIAAAITVCIQYLLLKLFGNFPDYPSLSFAIEIEKERIPFTTSGVLALAYHIAAIYQGAKSFIVSKIYNLFGVLIFVGGGFSIYLHFLLSISVFLLGKKELKRIVGPIALTEKPEIQRSEVAKLVFWLVILGIFTYFPILANIETVARNNSEIVSRLEEKILKVEEISGKYYRVGTVAETSQLKLKTLSMLKEETRRELEAEVDYAFDKM